MYVFSLRLLVAVLLCPPRMLLCTLQGLWQGDCWCLQEYCWGKSASTRIAMQHVHCVMHRP